MLKSFQPPPSVPYPSKNYFQNSFSCLICALDPISSKQEIYTRIFREDKLHIIGVTDFVDSVQVSLMEHSLRMDVIPDNFPIRQEGILGTDFLIDSALTDIRYDGGTQGFFKWHGIIILCTRQDTILILAKIAKVFYIKIKNLEVKMGLVSHLHLSNGLYAENALVTNRGERVYIKIVNTRDTDERIIASKVELKQQNRD